MKIDIQGAARELDLHPAELLLKLWSQGQVRQLEDCWPEVEQGLVDTLRQLEGLHRTSTTPLHTPPEEAAPLENDIVRVMRSRNHWGHNRIGGDQLKRFLPPGTDARSMNKALKELAQRELLQHYHGAYSLNTHRKAEIERYA